MGRHCRDLTRLLRHFHIQSPILCCHSYGVPIGLEWARRHQVSALVAIAGGTHNLILVVSGGKDPMFTTRMAADLAAYFTQGKHLHIDSAGHLVMAEYPETINQAIALLIL